jgi:protein involved in polysaccharide export with SLBB domain
MMIFRSALIAISILFLVSMRNAESTPTVHAGDTLSVNVLNYAAVIDDSNSRLSALNVESVIVAADGTISLPIAGTIHVSGKSTRQIRALVESRLAEYVRDPAVSVQLLHQSQQIFLTGATVGTLAYLPGETLSSALGQLREQLEKDLGAAINVSDKNGGTLTRTAIDLRKIVIQRDSHDSPPIDGEELLASGMPGPSLAPGDTILFANKPVRVNVRGQVNAPGPVYLYQGDTLEQALQQAGGPDGAASTSNATLVRHGEETPITLAGAAMRQVPQNGDTIIVRSAPHVSVLGQIYVPGEYTLKNGSTLLSALYVSGGPTKWANVRDIEVVHNGARTSYDLRGLTHGDLSNNVPLSDGDVVYVPEGHKIDATAFLQALGGVYDASHL